MRPPLNLSLYLVLCPQLCGGHKAAINVAKQAILGGATTVQLRASEWHKRALLNLALELRNLTQSHQAALIINDHVDVALASGADGVHVGIRDLPPLVARKLLGEDKLVGLSISTVKELQAANELDKGVVDYLGVGPVFSTTTKLDASAVIGAKELKEIYAKSKYPTVAIGGIGLDNARSVFNTCDGTQPNGIAIVSAICCSKDPRKISKSLLEIVRCCRQ